MRSRNVAVVPYKDAPVPGSEPTSSMSSRLSSVRTTPSTLTPLIVWMAARVTGWRYAMTAKVSSAAPESLAVLPAVTK